ncbi:MAG TPA: formate/nitrite transporter family protein [Kofleriaceae bacterium]|nr:formate/nitrite transporter family protein [Kofleriaceae bacterium]
MTPDPEIHDREERLEREEINERTAPSGKIVYEAIFQEGEEELARNSSALAWSGFAAGLSMGFSFLAVGLLERFLPDASWSPLIGALGISLGFLIVVLGRQQLFTENTLTVMLPMLRHRDRHTLGNVLRLWLVVLVANVVGALCFALVLARTQVVDTLVYTTLRDAAFQAASPSFAVAFVRAIFAGWLIALMVWLLPYAETARVAVIVILTYVIGLAHLSHVIVSTVEQGFLLFTGEISVGVFLAHSFVPSLLGNIVGGVALVAALNHAQVVSGET